MSVLLCRKHWKSRKQRGKLRLSLFKASSQVVFDSKKCIMLQTKAYYLSCSQFFGTFCICLHREVLGVPIFLQSKEFPIFLHVVTQWGNPVPEQDSEQGQGLLRPQEPRLLFPGSIAHVFKWEKLGFTCKVFLWKLGFFSLLKSTLAGRHFVPSQDKQATASHIKRV